MPNHTALYPGTFDVLSYGHLDIIKRTAAIFDKVIIAVAKNIDKSPIFSVEERIEMIEEATQGINNIIKICSFSGLTVDFAKENGVKVVIRGLRAVSDFEYELQLSMMNKNLNPDVETLFLAPSEQYSFLSSKLIKEIARFGGDIKEFVPPNVEKQTVEKLKSLYIQK